MSEIILSVVVPSYNSENYIEATLKTIAAEKNPKVEYLLIDGGSKDSTMSIVKRYEEHFSRIISEPDRGQSDAFNKGFCLAKGKYITWLNSDDIIFPGAIKRAIDFLAVCQSEWVTANSAYLDKEGRIKRFCAAGGYEGFAVKLGLLNVLGPSTFVSKKLFEEIGPFNLDFHYCMDAEYWWRIVRSNRKFSRMPIYFWGLRLHEDAKTANVILNNEYPPRMLEESAELRKKYHPVNSHSKRKISLWLVRLYRILNLSMPKALFLTWQYKGKKTSKFNKYL